MAIMMRINNIATLFRGIEPLSYNAKRIVLRSI